MILYTPFSIFCYHSTQREKWTEFLADGEAGLRSKRVRLKSDKGVKESVKRQGEGGFRKKNSNPFTCIQIFACQFTLFHTTHTHSHTHKFTQKTHTQVHFLTHFIKQTQLNSKRYVKRISCLHKEQF
jgi:hypothetical protein